MATKEAPISFLNITLTRRSLILSTAALGALPFVGAEPTTRNFHIDLDTRPIPTPTTNPESQEINPNHNQNGAILPGEFNLNSNIEQKTEKPKLRISIIPQTLTIPTLGLVQVEITKIVMKRNGQLDVPEQGIATPNGSIGKTDTNNIWIYGHSRWMGIPQLLYSLKDINLGDLITIDGQMIPQQKTSKLNFTVDKILLEDRESAIKEINDEKPNLPRLIIQTSVRENGTDSTGNAKPWIFNRNAIEKKAQSKIEGEINDPSKYLFLFVIAQPTAETMTRLRDFQN